MAVAELILKTGNEERRYPLSGAPCGIGRSVHNAIVLQSDMVSRNHAMIQVNESGGYSIFDLGSRNGTFLNGRRVGAPVVLHDRDVVAIGEFALVFSEPTPQAEAEKPAHETLVMLAPREITVVVIDIRDFTALARQLGETRIAALIGAFNRETGTIFETARTWAVKYIGDAAMAIWDHKFHPDAAAVLRSVFQAVAAVGSLVDGLRTRFDLPGPLRVGVGINTGVAALGNLGSGTAPDYTALGDVVNKAFRLESATRQLDAEVAFGDEVRALLGDSLVAGVARSDRVKLKGYSEACDVYTMPLAKVPELANLLGRGVTD